MIGEKMNEIRDLFGEIAGKFEKKDGIEGKLDEVIKLLREIRDNTQWYPWWGWSPPYVTWDGGDNTLTIHTNTDTAVYDGDNGTAYKCWGAN